MKFNSPKKYSGAAALLFLLIFPGLFAVFVWGVEGARILQSDARLKDATESAALAVSTQTDVTETLCDDLTKAFLNGYFPTATVETSESPCVNTEKPNEFQINASISEKTWFPNSNIASYGTSFTVSNGIKATKKIEPVDVVLVANYANSMKGIKEDQLETVVDLVVEQLGSSDLTNKLALVGFDHYVSSFETYETGFGIFKSTQTRWKIDHYLVCEGDSHISENCLKKSVLDSLISQGINIVSGLLNLFGLELKIPDIKSLLGAIDENVLFNPENINVNKTFEQIFDDVDNPVSLFDLFFGANKNAIDDIKVSDHKHSSYDSIALTSSFNKISGAVKSNDFKVFKGNTGVESASYTGLIAGARIAAQGGNPRKLIVLLTDGKEQAPDVARKLMNSNDNLCHYIKNNFPDSSSIDLAIIGFDFDDSYDEGEAIKNCIGSSNTYAYTGNSDTDSAMLDKLLNINSKNVGRLIN